MATIGPTDTTLMKNVPRGSEHQLCTNMGQSSDPSDDYMLRVRWKAHIFFWAKTDMPQKMTHLWFYYNSPNGCAHSNCTAILSKGVWLIPKVTVPMPKPIAMRHHM